MGKDNTKDKKNCDPSGLGLFGQFFGVQSQLAKSTEEEMSLGVTCTLPREGAAQVQDARNCWPAQAFQVKSLILRP